MITQNIELSYGSKIIGGCDEVGRGPLAGPVVAACVIFDASVPMINGINDSKKISIKKREELNTIICTKYLYAIGQASVDEIEEINILNATKLAITRAVQQISRSIDVILVDGNMKFEDERFVSIIKGDQNIYTIACASIIAKVYRDRLMNDLAQIHPHYYWERNAGYGTKKHMDAIKENGITEHHRKSFIHL